MEQRVFIIERLKREIVVACNLLDVDPEKIDAQEPLFGPDNKLGIDSLDALEVALILKTHFQLKVEGKSEQRKVFATIETLANYIEQHARKEDICRFVG